VLIADHSWILNLKKIFKGKKYIIRVTPSVGGDQSSDPIIETVTQSQIDLEKKMHKIQFSFQQKIDEVDVNNKYLLEKQGKSI
jgi:hypothetical protein